MDIKICFALLFIILVWIVWRLQKNQERFSEIEKQLQLLFKRLDDFFSKHA